MHRPPRVALTFDDGPWPDSTQQVLAILGRMGVRATFFDVGYLARDHPDLVRRELDAGMVVGNHSWDHPITPPFRDLPHPRITSEIRRTNTELDSIGVKPQLFRPPGGSYSPWVLKEAARQGVRVVLWSVDPRDWKPGTKARRIVHSVLSHVRPGSIILLHDGGGDRSATVTALPAHHPRHPQDGPLVHRPAADGAVSAGDDVTATASPARRSRSRFSSKNPSYSASHRTWSHRTSRVLTLGRDGQRHRPEDSAARGQHDGRHAEFLDLRPRPRGAATGPPRRSRGSASARRPRPGRDPPATNASRRRSTDRSPSASWMRSPIAAYRRPTASFPSSRPVRARARRAGTLARGRVGQRIVRALVHQPKAEQAPLDAHLAHPLHLPDPFGGLPRPRAGGGRSRSERARSRGGASSDGGGRLDDRPTSRREANLSPAALRVVRRALPRPGPRRCNAATASATRAGAVTAAPRQRSQRAPRLVAKDLRTTAPRTWRVDPRTGPAAGLAGPADRPRGLLPESARAGDGACGGLRGTGRQTSRPRSMIAWSQRLGYSSRSSQAAAAASTAEPPVSLRRAAPVRSRGGR